MSCPGETIAIMCCEEVDQQTSARQKLVMGGTNNLFDRNNNRMKTEFEVVEEIKYLTWRYMNCGIEVAIMCLTGRS